MTHRVLDGTYMLGDPDDRIPVIDFRYYQRENSYVLDAGWEKGRLTVTDNDMAQWREPLTDIYPNQLFRLIQRPDGEFKIQNVSSGFYITFNGKDKFKLTKIA
jgi:hypothetical protein